MIYHYQKIIRHREVWRVEAENFFDALNKMWAGEGYYYSKAPGSEELVEIDPVTLEKICSVPNVNQNSRSGQRNVSADGSIKQTDTVSAETPPSSETDV